MTQKELLIRCSIRDQVYYDHNKKKLDVRAFTDLIDPDRVPYTSLVDYHIVVNRHGEVFHTFLIEARYLRDAENFFYYLRNDIIEPGTISDYIITQVSNLDYYQLTITIS